MISVVTPWVILESERPSTSKRRPEWLWISMKPGQTTIPLASTTSPAECVEMLPGRRDLDDPVARQRHIGVEPGVAGAVDHASAANQHVNCWQCACPFECLSADPRYFAPGPFTNWPGLAPVCSPSCSTRSPLTHTSRMPTES